jgi:hypothetical protein
VHYRAPSGSRLTVAARGRLQKSHDRVYACEREQQGGEGTGEREGKREGSGEEREGEGG